MHRICAVVAVLLALWANPASAGIVNVQSSLVSPADEGLSGSLTGSALLKTGNVELLILRGQGTARYRSGDHLWVAIINGNFGRNTDGTFLSRTFEHIRYRYRLNKRLTAEAFTQHEYAKFRRLTFRALFGAGPKIDIVQKKKYSMAVGVAYMLELERLLDDGEIDAGNSDTAHRASSYVTGHYELDKRLQLVETFYVQPRLDDFGDIRLLNQSSLVVKANDKLSFSTSFSIAYDRAPPATIKRVDTQLTSSITLSF
jgi:hypothetical protein